MHKTHIEPILKFPELPLPPLLPPQAHMSVPSHLSFLCVATGVVRFGSVRFDSKRYCSIGVIASVRFGSIRGCLRLEQNLSAQELAGTWRCIRKVPVGTAASVSLFDLRCGLGQPVNRQLHAGTSASRQTTRAEISIHQHKPVLGNGSLKPLQAWMKMPVRTQVLQVQAKAAARRTERNSSFGRRGIASPS